MTPSDYRDPAVFPLTTQAGLSAKEQLLLDAFNLDSLHEALEQGVTQDQDQKGRLKELEEKAAFLRALLKQMDEEE